MKSFKIAVWLNTDNIPQLGGGFSYVEQLIEEINNKTFNSNLEIYFAGFNLNTKLNKTIINIPFKSSYLETKRVNFFHKFFNISLKGRYFKKNQLRAIRILKEYDIELIFYPTPVKFIYNFPYIIVNWDLGHRSTYAFPEMILNNSFTHREQTVFNNINESLFICCESETGRNELISFFNINPQKIKILPLFSSKVINSEIEVKKPTWINSGSDFFMYPAQFWPHKNHINLIFAFKRFIETNENFLLILPGSDKGNFNYVKQTVLELALTNNIVFPGFISNEELKWLYLNTVGLVFPSFLGPTNMPLLEAQNLKCSIACSNLEGHREMLKEEAIYFDPKDIESILSALNQLVNEKTVPNPNKTFNIINSLDQLEHIFNASIFIRRAWGQFDKIY